MHVSGRLAELRLGESPQPAKYAGPRHARRRALTPMCVGHGPTSHDPILYNYRRHTVRNTWEELGGGQGVGRVEILR